MPPEASIRRYRLAYAALIRLYPTPFRTRYGEGLEQTFSDLLRDRARERKGLFVCAVWMCLETSAGIIRENIIHMTTYRTLWFVLSALSLLLIPFIAMQLEVPGVDWQLNDYVIMSVLLTGAAVALAAATNQAFATRKRIFGFGLVVVLAILYVHMAVGIVDTWPLAGS